MPDLSAEEEARAVAYRAALRRRIAANRALERSLRSDGTAAAQVRTDCAPLTQPAYPTDLDLED